METDVNGNWMEEYIFFGGRRVAMRKALGFSSSVHYYFVDQLGSTNVMTNVDASVTEQDIEYHPYGEQQVYTDTQGQEYRFTGKEHDPETNNDYFGARYYSSAIGRFITLDWAAGCPTQAGFAWVGMFIYALWACCQACISSADGPYMPGIAISLSRRYTPSCAR